MPFGYDHRPVTVRAVGGRGIVLASAVFLGFLSWPALSPSEIDSLPLSNYPMFAHPRAEVSRFDSAVLIDAAGKERRLDPHTIGGTEEPMQAAMTVRQAIRTGAAEALCEEIAADLAVDGTVEVVSVRYDTVAWFRGDREPIARDVHARCDTQATP